MPAGAGGGPQDQVRHCSLCIIYRCMHVYMYIHMYVYIKLHVHIHLQLYEHVYYTLYIYTESCLESTAHGSQG